MSTIWFLFMILVIGGWALYLYCVRDYSSLPALDEYDKKFKNSTIVVLVIFVLSLALGIGIDVGMR